MVKDLGREMGSAHDVFAGAEAGGDGLENFGFYVGIAKKFGLAKLLVFFDVVYGEELAEDVVWLGVGESTLLDELIAALRVWISNIAGDGKDGFALINGVSGGIEGTRLFGGFDYHHDIREARDEAVAVEEGGGVGVTIFAWRVFTDNGSIFFDNFFG